jgi:protein TonB
MARKSDVNTEALLRMTALPQDTYSVAEAIPTPAPTPLTPLTPVATPEPTHRPLTVPTRTPQPIDTVRPASSPFTSQQSTVVSPVPTQEQPVLSTPAADAELPSLPPSSTVQQAEARQNPEPASETSHSEAQPDHQAILTAYLQKIALQLHETKNYPRTARRKGWEGTVVVKLFLLPSGELERAELGQTSGIKTLDEAALKSIQKAQPFPAFPEDISVPSLIVNIPIQFHLK